AQVVRDRQDGKTGTGESRAPTTLEQRSPCALDGRPVADAESDVDEGRQRRGSLGPDGDRAPIARERLVEAAQIAEDVAAAMVGVGIVGLEGDGAIIARKRLAGAVELNERDAPAVVGLGVAGLEGDGTVVARQRLGRALELEQDVAAIVVSFGEGGFESDGALVACQRLGGALELLEAVAHVEHELGRHARAVPYCPRVVVDRFLVPAEGRGSATLVVMGDRPAGPQLQRSCERGRRLGIPARRQQRQAEVVAAVRIPGPRGAGLFQPLRRLLVPPGHGQGRPQIVEDLSGRRGSGDGPLEDVDRLSGPALRHQDGRQKLKQVRIVRRQRQRPASGRLRALEVPPAVMAESLTGEIGQVHAVRRRHVGKTAMEFVRQAFVKAPRGCTTGKRAAQTSSPRNATGIRLPARGSASPASAPDDAMAGSGDERDMHRGRKLRQALAGKGLVTAPGVYDMVSARVADGMGFSALYMTGYGVSATLGLPDAGLASYSEMVE